MNDTGSTSAISSPGVYSLVIRTRAALYMAWMPLLRGGGLFVPSSNEHRLGEEVLVVLTLLDEQAKFPIHGRIAWVNPPNAAANRPRGYGVQLSDTESCRELRKRVDKLLGGVLQSSRPTHTL